MYMHWNLPITISQRRHTYDVMISLLNMLKSNRIDLKGCIEIFCSFDLIFTSHQQSFSYKGTGFPGLNQ